MTTILVLVMLMPFAAGPQSQPRAIDRGMAAEAAGRWEDALVIYTADLRRDPKQSDLWLRVAEIQSRLGHPKEALQALTSSAAASPRIASSVDYQRRLATLATWTGAYARAKDAYARVLQLAPGDADAALGLARVSAWSGDSDRAVSMYRQYLDSKPDSRGAWIELARTETWRGNYAASLDALSEYRQRFGTSPELDREWAAVLARGGRPREATRLVEGLLPAHPTDYGLHVSRTIALAARQRSVALSSFDAVQRLQPEGPETRGVESLVRVALASTLVPQGAGYSDSDGLRVWRIDPRVDFRIFRETRLRGGYERSVLRARPASGLEGITGSLQQQHQYSWLGLSQQAGVLTIHGRGGYATLDARNRFSYSVATDVAFDTFQASVGRESAYVLISPRTMSLGLTRLTHSADIVWTPTLRYRLQLDGSYDEFSDGNRRWDVWVTPSRVVARTQRLNLDLGLQARQLGTTRHLDNGYYDPSRYENYSAIAFPYWKISENVGLGGALALGIQRDDARRRFRFAENGSLELTMGIYREWTLKVNGSTTFNDRLATGAYRGYSAQAAIVRRF